MATNKAIPPDKTINVHQKTFIIITLLFFQKSTFYYTCQILSVFVKAIYKRHTLMDYVIIFPRPLIQMACSDWTRAEKMLYVRYIYPASNYLCNHLDVSHQYENVIVEQFGFYVAFPVHFLWEAPIFLASCLLIIVSQASNIHNDLCKAVAGTFGSHRQRREVDVFTDVY